MYNEKNKFVPEDGISYWDLTKKDLRDVKKVKVPYKLIIETDGWIGNFDRELIGYAFGILDGVQMENDFALNERKLFWKEVFQKDTPIEFEEPYELYDKYFCKTFQCVDDWYQITFYNIGCRSENTSHIFIQFNEIPPNMELYITRIKKFFNSFGNEIQNSRLVDLYISDIKNQKTKLL
jgi:hypothetical protein